MSDSVTLRTTEDSDDVTPKETLPIEPNASTDLVAEMTSINDKAKEFNIDLDTFLLHQCLSSRPTTYVQAPPVDPNSPDKIVKIIGKMSEGEDIVVFLNRFELELGSRHIDLDDFRLYLPQCLSGPFKEAYYNNLGVCPTYQDVRVVLLNAGGYSLSVSIAFRSSLDHQVTRPLSNSTFSVNYPLPEMSRLNVFLRLLI